MPTQTNAATDPGAAERWVVRFAPGSSVESRVALLAGADVEVLEELLEMLHDAEPKGQFLWNNQERVYFMAPGVREPWATVCTKRLAGVDLILSGHLHQSYIGNSEEFYPKKGQPAVVVLHSGTTTSRRGRGAEREKNSCNWIRIDERSMIVSHYRWHDNLNRFAEHSRHWYPRQEITPYTLEGLDEDRPAPVPEPGLHDPLTALDLSDEPVLEKPFSPPELRRRRSAPYLFWERGRFWMSIGGSRWRRKPEKPMR